MKSLAAALLILASLASPSVAGWRCNRSYYQTYASSANWSSGCYQCHPQPHKKAAAYNWREAITTIERQKIETQAFLTALQTISPQGQVTAQGYPGGYQSQYASEYSSYPVAGSSLYGVQSYSTNPLIDLNAAFQTQSKLAQQLTAGAHATAADAADLTSLAYQLENDRQAKIAAFQSITAVAQGAPPQPTATQFRQQMTVSPSGATTTVTTSATGQATATAQGQPVIDGLAVLESKCASCHAGQNISGGFDLAKLTPEGLARAIERINLPPDDPKHMPQVPTDSGYVPGQPLEWRERHAVEALLLQGK